ncbi:MAG: HepT-like ribonuclease domain-containing protein [Ignavibacteriaceae bacterium]
MKDNDRIRIQHIIDASEEALSFVLNVDRENFFKNRMLILSIIKEIEIIGEAASKISEETKLQYSHIPWKDIVGMRNRLIHGYFDVNVELVWNTTKNNLPPLIKSLKEILPEIE